LRAHSKAERREGLANQLRVWNEERRRRKSEWDHGLKATALASPSLKLSSLAMAKAVVVVVFVDGEVGVVGLLVLSAAVGRGVGGFSFEGVRALSVARAFLALSSIKIKDKRLKGQKVSCFCV